MILVVSSGSHEVHEILWNKIILFLLRNKTTLQRSLKTSEIQVQKRSTFLWNLGMDNIEAAMALDFSDWTSFPPRFPPSPLAPVLLNPSGPSLLLCYSGGLCRGILSPHSLFSFQIPSILKGSSSKITSPIKCPWWPQLVVIAPLYWALEGLTVCDDG